MIEPVAYCRFHQARRFRAGELFLGLPLELRIAQEHRQFGRQRRQHVLGHHLQRALVVAVVAPSAQGFQQRRAKARLMRATLRRRHGIGVGMQKTVRTFHPRASPFHAAGAAAVGRFRQLGLVRPGFRNGPRQLADFGGQAVLQPTRKMQHGLGRRVVADQGRRARPADFHAAEQIGLRPAKPVQPGRAERQNGPENLRIRLEAYRRPAAVLHGTRIDQFRRRLAAGIALAEQHAIARHLHLHHLGQRIHHRTAHAMQPAGRIIGLAGELTA